MRSRCSRRLAIADSADRGTVMFYHDCLVALANARRNLLTCDDQGRRDIFGYLRNLSRMSPRECSPTREMDMVQLDAAIVEPGRVANETIGSLHGADAVPMDEDSSDISENLLEEQRRFRYRFIRTAIVSLQQQMSLVSQVKSLFLKLRAIYVRFMRDGLELSEGLADSFRMLTIQALKRRFGNWKLSKTGGRASYDS